MKEIYCTYFDHNYLSRAIVTINSLRQFDETTPIYIVALSDICVEVLQKLDLPYVKIITLATIERTYPELLDLKAERTTIEYYFTLTAFLPHFLFGETTADRITYIDADLYFVTSPRTILDSLGDASVAITPHRFSLPYKNHVKYGRFNVGWITYRRCDEGLRCVSEYKADCTAWCFDRLEGERYGDQKYLDAWPGRYASLKIIEDKGVNVAKWNIQNHTVRMKDGRLMIDDDPLVFYHFASTTFLRDGGVHIDVPNYGGRSMRVLTEYVLAPYAQILENQSRELRTRFPALAGAKSSVREVWKDTLS